MLRFEDVKNCGDVAEFNHFVRQYLDERDFQGEERKATYWALFYAWKEGFLDVEQLQKRFSWVPMAKARAQLSRNGVYVILVMEGRLYSLKVERLLDLIAGHVETMRIFRFEEHEQT